MFFYIDKVNNVIKSENKNLGTLNITQKWQTIIDYHKRKYENICLILINNNYDNKEIKYFKNIKGIKDIFICENSNKLKDNIDKGDKGLIHFINRNKEEKYNNIIIGANDKYIPIQNNFLHKLNENFSENINFFLNKNIQRKYINKYKPNLNIKNIYININLGIKKIIEKIEENNLEFPLIFKPIDGHGSKGVFVVKDINEIENKIIEYFKNGDCNSFYNIEEFITGDMYSTDLFIKKKGDINFLPPIYIETKNKNFGDSDFSNIIRYTGNFELKGYDIFLKDVKELLFSMGVKNQFCHIEFCIDKNGNYKIIEINGRMGGYRFEIYDYSYGINYMDLIYNDYKKEKIKYYIGFIKRNNNKKIEKIKYIKNNMGLENISNNVFNIKNISKYSISKNNNKFNNMKTLYSIDNENIILKSKDYFKIKNDIDFFKKNYNYYL